MKKCAGRTLTFLNYVISRKGGGDKIKGPVEISCLFLPSALSWNVRTWFRCGNKMLSSSSLILDHIIHFHLAVRSGTIWHCYGTPCSHRVGPWLIDRAAALCVELPGFNP